MNGPIYSYEYKLENAEIGESIYSCEDWRISCKTKPKLKTIDGSDPKEAEEEGKVSHQLLFE